MSEAPNTAGEVLVRVDGEVGRLTLNRPKALHALTTSMCVALTEALLAWRDDPQVQVVILDHTGERGFCAGGDVRMLADSGKGDGAAAREFFFNEYRLNHLIFGYPKPIVTVMDGIVMGGGVGLAQPSAYRIATERTTFAMPESGIGLFPDVGGGWFLPRLASHAGFWLALTGARIKAADCLRLGIATHVVESAKLEELKAAIVAEPGKLASVIDAAAGDAGPAPIAAHEQAMEHAFGQASVEAILADLERSPWGREQAAAMATKSPQTLKVALRQLQTGLTLTNFADNMAMEYRLGARIVHSHDFAEGVRAVLIDKDNQPRWNPPTLAAIADADLDKLFAPLPAQEEWSPLA